MVSKAIIPTIFVLKSGLRKVTFQDQKVAFPRSHIQHLRSVEIACSRGCGNKRLQPHKETYLTKRIGKNVFEMLTLSTVSRRRKLLTNILKDACHINSGKSSCYQH